MCSWTGGFKWKVYYTICKKGETRNLLPGTFLWEFTAGDSLSEDFSALNHNNTTTEGYASKIMVIQVNFRKLHFPLKKERHIYSISRTPAFYLMSSQLQKLFYPRKEQSKIHRGFEFWLLLSSVCELLNLACRFCWCFLTTWNQWNLKQLLFSPNNKVSS